MEISHGFPRCKAVFWNSWWVSIWDFLAPKRSTLRFTKEFEVADVQTHRWVSPIGSLMGETRVFFLRLDDFSGQIYNPGTVPYPGCFKPTLFEFMIFRPFFPFWWDVLKLVAQKKVVRWQMTDFSPWDVGRFRKAILLTNMALSL